MHLRDYLKEWRKNPQWSFSCCLALVLPLISLPGDISGLVGTNMTKNQLDTGGIDMPTIAAAVQDSGAVDVTLEEGDEGDDEPAESQNDNHIDAQPQTEKGGLPIKVAAVQDSGAVDVTLEEGEQGDDDPAESQNDNHIDAKPQSGEGDLPIKFAALGQDSEEVDAALVKDEQGNDYSAKV